MRTPEAAAAKRLGWILGLSMFSMGICGLSYEYSFSRLATQILGDSTKQWALVIGVMMLFMGLGADLQKYLGERWLVERFIGLEILLGLVGGLGPALSLYVFGAAHELFILVHYLLIATVGLLIGLEIPLMARVNEACLTRLKDNLGMILKMDYIGSFVGALVWVFVLPQFFDFLEIPYLLGLVNLTVALVTLWAFRSFVGKPWLLALPALMAIALLGGAMYQGQAIRLHLEQKLFKDPIIFSHTSRYQHIVMTKNRRGELDTYINGHLQFSSRDEAIYHEFLVHPVMAASDNPKRVLVMGGGDGLAVRELLRWPIESVTLVDLDPEMVELARTQPELVALNQGSLRDARVNDQPAKGVGSGGLQELYLPGQGYFRRSENFGPVEVQALTLDAFEFATSAPGVFDVIILDFPDPNDPQLSKLYSLEFYQQLRQKLKPGGLMVQQSTSPAFALPAFRIIGRTLQAAGWSVAALHHPVPSFGDWGFWVAGPQEFFGQRGLQQRLAQINQLPEDLKYLTPELIPAAQVFGKNQLDLSQAPVNRLLAERLYQAYQQSWARLQ
ncbi:MAG: polyamine aminopropyltransferase [bacterium]|nr:polyamine aminopropyltransferase [bacterium]